MSSAPTPITDMITEMLKNCIPKEMIILAVRSMELALSTRQKVDDVAEKRRAWDRDYRRKRRGHPPDPPDIHPNPPDVGDASSSFLEEDKKHSEEVIKKKKERGTKLPPDWIVKQPHYVEGLARGLGRSRVDELADNMRNWCAANANRSITTKADWDATFMGFIRREPSNGNGNHNASRRSASADFFAGIASVAADIAGNDQPSRDAAPEVPLGRFNIDG